MTDTLIKYFLKYVKYDNKVYYIDNYKTVFEFLKKPIDEKLTYCEFSIPYLFYKYIDITKKIYIRYRYEIIHEDLEVLKFSKTMDDIIDIFNYFNQDTIIFNDDYKDKFKPYIMYLLDKKFKTDEQHEKNEFIKYKKNLIYLHNYDTTYKISNSIHYKFNHDMINYINKQIENKINNSLSDLLNNNHDILKNIVQNLNEESKNVLINEIIKYNEGEIMEKTSKNIKNDSFIKNMCDDMINKCEDKFNVCLNERINNYIKSDETQKIFKQGLEDFIYYLPPKDIGQKIYDYAKNMDINKDLTKRVENINNKIKTLQLKYQNINYQNTYEEVKEDKEDKEELKENRIDANAHQEQEINKCFGIYGKQYNLKLGELMKFTKYKHQSEFKEYLKTKNIIKSDFKIAGSTYRLTTEQKTQFINDFINLFQ